jgi:hypothetical protein
MPKAGKRKRLVAEARASKQMRQAEFPHQKMIGTPISREVAKLIFPVYQRLTSPFLLEKCLGGYTQNANESLHSVLWSKVPKQRFFNYARFRYSTGQAVGEFNEGVAHLRRQIDSMGWSVGDYTLRIQKKKDILRLRYSSIKNSIKTLNRAKVRDAGRNELNRRAGRKVNLYKTGASAI